MDIVFATHNLHKLQEVQDLLSDRFRILSLSELEFHTEIPEDHLTLEENASQKAWFIHERTGSDCFADDTGLEVDALGGEPGVFSARYSRMGDIQFPEMDAAAGNIRKLLLRMEGEKDRKARFRTVISLILSGKESRFEGIVEGSIRTEVAGVKGFGYDPVFVPEGFAQSFAEMELSQKNKISHRALATQKLAHFLQEM